MDYKIYDRLQAELGCIGDEFSRNCSAILEKSAAIADEQSKQLVEEICAANTSALNDLAKSISDALIAAAN